MVIWLAIILVLIFILAAWPKPETKVETTYIDPIEDLNTLEVQN